MLPSPNSGWSETAAAGALNLTLVGPIWKDDIKVVDQWVGPRKGQKNTEIKHIYQMNQLAFYTSILFVGIFCILMHL
jgi:cobalamin biosynthesis protein CobD/CbiB